MSNQTWSVKDLVNKWTRKLPSDVQRCLPWDVLETLASGLSEDTKLPRDVLNECIRTRDIYGLFALADSLDPTVYGSADLLLQDRLVVELFSKFDFPDSPFNKRDKAKFRFFEAEEMCRETNFRLSRAPMGLSNDVNAVIHRAIRICEKVLGSFSVNEMLSYSRFGPGASIGVSGPFTTEYFKLCEKNPTVSPEAFPYAEALLAYDHQWNGYLHGIHPFDIYGPFSPITGEGVELCITDHNKVTFVLKNAKTDRSIAIEPYFNVFFQLGVGGMIRKRLFKNARVNLDSQLRNQALAKIGSILNNLATIDFSMASDTISRETVRLFLPPSWFLHLDRLRSKNYLMDGSVRPYHKFSSMGNGYTFELETLIFYSTAVACCEELGLDTENVTVYGDDVILPKEACELYEKTCKYLGFKVNDEKSFSNGPFRESCGEDFLNGVRARPVFCKELATVQHVVSLANRLSELNRSVGPGSRVNHSLRLSVDCLLSRIPRDVRRYVVGPPSEDVDGYIHTTDIEKLSRSPLVKWDRRLFAWAHPTIRFRPRRLTRRDDATALWITYGMAQRHNPIPRVKATVDLLGKLRGRHTELTDFIQETVPRQITGREIGKMTLGRSLVWSLGSDVTV